MMPVKTQSELNAILQLFDISSNNFILDRTIYAGPDEILYLLHDTNNQKIGIWVRDHMENLPYETNYLNATHKIQPIEWLQTASDNRVEIDGDSYAVFLYH